MTFFSSPPPPHLPPTKPHALSSPDAAAASLDGHLRHLACSLLSWETLTFCQKDSIISIFTVSILCSNQIVGFPNNIKAYDGIVWVEPNKHLMKGWMRALLEHSELEQDSQVFKKSSTYVRLVRRPMAKEPNFFLQLWFHWTSESPWSLSPCVLISLPPTLHCLLSERSPHCTESKTYQLSNGFN